MDDLFLAIALAAVCLAVGWIYWPFAEIVCALIKMGWIRLNVTNEIEDAKP